MNKRQIEVEKAKLAAEKKELLHLKAIYDKAAQDIAKKLQVSNGKINVLLKDFDSLDEVQKSILQSQIYQRNFQLSLKKQIDGFLKDLNTDQYESIDQYMKDCYKTGYLGSMYDLHGQGIPIVTLIDQKQIAEAIKINSKISKRLYKKLGEDVDFLKKRIANNIARGIATASEYKVIARNIAADSNMGFNRAMRIARTEGHGMQCQAAEAAQHAAKKAGADVLKQWDAALDKRTRASHARVDGEIRELDEKFSNGMMRPADKNGGAAEVVNCRCALLQRARWALDEDELQTLKDRAAYFGLDKADNFNDFSKKYLKAVEGSGKSSKIIGNKNKPIPIVDAAKGANPNFNKGTEYKVNCQRCVQAYELRRRGYHVIAKPKPSSGNKISWGSECFMPAGTDAVRMYTLGQTEAKVKKVLKEAEDGARYSIYIKWKGRNSGAHVFIAEKENGTIRYLDPQTGNENVERYFANGRNGNYGYFRMDDKPLTDDEAILEATVEVEQ